MSEYTFGKAMFIVGLIVGLVGGLFGGAWLERQNEPEAVPEVRIKTVTEEKVVTKEVPAILPEACQSVFDGLAGFESGIDAMDEAAGQIGLLASDVHKFAATDDFNNTVLTIEELNKQIDILDSEVIAKSDSLYQIDEQLDLCQSEID